MAARLSRPSKIMLAVTGLLLLFAVWTLFLTPEQVRQANLAPAVWSATPRLPPEAAKRVAGLALVLRQDAEGYAAAGLAQAKRAQSAGVQLLLSLEPVDAPVADPQTAARSLKDWLQREGLKPAILVSPDWPLLEALNVLEGTPRLAFATAEARIDRAAASPWLGGRDLGEVEGSLPALVRAAGGDLWAPPLSDLRPEDLADARRLGLSVLVTGADDPATFASLLKLRPDAVLTTQPEALLQAVDAQAGVFAVSAAPK